MGAILSVLCAISWALSVVLFKKYASHLDPNLINLAKNSIGLALLTAATSFFVGWDFSSYSHLDLGIVLFSGALGVGLGDSIYFRGLIRIGAMRTGIVECLYSPLVALLAWWMIGESLSSLQLVGFCTILVAVFLVSYSSDHQATTDNVALGVFEVASAVLMFAFGMVVAKPQIERLELLQLVTLRMAAGTLVTWIWLPISGRGMAEIKELFSLHIGFYFSCAVAGFFSILFWIAGFKYSLASIAAVLNQSATLFTVLFAVLFLSEKMTQRKFAATVLGFIGVITVATSP